MRDSVWMKRRFHQGRTYQQYESAMEPMATFVTNAQHSKVFVHMELFEAWRALEALSASFFVMFNNISLNTGVRGAKDLTVCAVVFFVSYHVRLF